MAEIIHDQLIPSQNPGMWNANPGEIVKDPLISSEITGFNNPHKQ
jgi:hypothetical protein